MNTLSAPAALTACLLALACAATALPGSARAQDAATAALADQVRGLALKSAQPVAGLRVEVEAGSLDPRLKLAPCQQIEPYLPAGFKPWGRTRVGLRCLQGPTKWNVYLPITVKVFGRALVAATALPAGTVLTAADLREAEIDLAADLAPALTDPNDAIGRSLLRTVSAGEDLRQNRLRARQWFAAGETVQLFAVGAGFSVQSEGQAITPGLDGSPVRVRTESGRIVTGVPVGERRVELRL
ncbi:flagellar basal body P-ring formation chaperone FlgA [Methylibium sp.]|uniref:flagellar basal body P-ring formation chaperone FlgA n=1 Tax=Methylibium sp. TaxID=2067992 RepID=UPI003D127D45